MLTTLRIKNLALVTDLTLELQPGYNVITGETGAGKSILIGALNLVLGERADRTLIRSGGDTCTVEALFDVTRLKQPLGPLLEESGLERCGDGQLVLKRSFTSSGTNRQFVNGSPTTLSVLSAIGAWLVDIHGPHEHQSLLHASSQLAILDAFAGLNSEREAFGALVQRRAAIEAEKAALIVDEKTYAQQLDLLRFQANEIAEARLQAEEEQQLEQDFRRTSNAAKLRELGQAAIEATDGEETSVLPLSARLGRILVELSRLDPSASALLEQHQQAAAMLLDLKAGISDYLDKVEVDPARLKLLEERMNLLQSLKRKYGSTAAAVLAFGAEAQRKLQSLEQRDSELARLNGELERIEAEIWRVGQELSAKRRKIIPQLSKAAARQLADLGFKQSQFDIALTTLQRPPRDATLPVTRPSATGLDTIEFLFAPNPGEPARPLRAIASSGELARVMLALKTVLAAVDQIPVLVFDEVDANVGGQTANAVGEKMLQIARQRQVLCITHLPQVAAPASAHFVATKQFRGGRTVSEINLLEPQERVTELARMLGGQTEAARRHAASLLKEGSSPSITLP